MTRKYRRPGSYARGSRTERAARGCAARRANHARRARRRRDWPPWRAGVRARAGAARAGSARARSRRSRLAPMSAHPTDELGERDHVCVRPHPPAIDLAADSLLGVESTLRLEVTV